MHVKLCCIHQGRLHFAVKPLQGIKPTGQGLEMTQREVIVPQVFLHQVWIPSAMQRLFPLSSVNSSHFPQKKATKGLRHA